MSNKIKVSIPLNNSIINELRAGDRVLLSGTIYTARDAAHKRMIENLKKGIPIPFDIDGEVIYYVGMCPAKPNFAAGSAGPTTSGRMDKYTPTLIGLGLKGMIGKGTRDKSVIEAIKNHNCVYFAAIGGTAVLIADSIKKEEVIAYEDLGTEAIKKLWVEDMQVIVAIDSKGNNIYDIEPTKYENMFTNISERGDNE